MQADTLVSVTLRDKDCDLTRHSAGQDLPVIEHALTHFDWRLHPLRWELPTDLAPQDLAAIEARLPPGGRWHVLARALEAGLPAPVRKLLLAAPAPGTARLPFSP